MNSKYKIIPIEKYNTSQKLLYVKAVKEWKPGSGGFPNIAFYYFFDEEGKKKETGYVLLTKYDKNYPSEYRRHEYFKNIEDAEKEAKTDRGTAWNNNGTFREVEILKTEFFKTFH